MNIHTLLTVVLSILLFVQTSIAQDSPLKKGNIIFSPGLSFGSNTYLNVPISKMVTNRIEVGGAGNFFVRHFNRSETTSVVLNEVTEPYLPFFGERVTRNRQTEVQIGAGAFYNYHIPLHSKIDVFVGQAFSINFSQSLQNVFQQTTSGKEYFEEVKTDRKTPLRITPSTGVRAGVQYFFHPQFSFGLHGGVSVGAGFQRGNLLISQTLQRSGANVSDPYFITSDTKSKLTETNVEATFGGSGSIFFTYVFNKKKKRPSTDVPTEKL